MSSILAFLSKYKNYIIWIVVIGVIAFFALKIYSSFNKVNEENTLLKKEILAKDTLDQIAPGKASKLDNTFATAGDLNTQQKTQDASLLDTIKKRNETILSLSNIVLSMQNQKQITPVIENKDSTYSFTSYYPKKDSAFIQYDGNLNTKTKQLNDTWSFNPLKVNVTLTQRKDGLWDTYLDAPTFVKIDSIKVNSLPPAKYVPTAQQQKLFVLYGGLGVRGNTNSDMTNKSLLLKGAVSIKDKVLIEADYGTDNKVGAGVLVKF